MADPVLNIEWPIAIEKAVVSERDRNHPFLKDIQSMEANNGRQ